MECAKPKKMVTGAQLPSLRIHNPISAAQAARKLIGDLAYEVFLVMYLNKEGVVHA